MICDKVKSQAIAAKPDAAINANMKELEYGK